MMMSESTASKLNFAMKCLSIIASVWRSVITRETMYRILVGMG